MSVWSSVEGEIRFSREDHGCSLKTMIEELYSETIITVKRVTPRMYEIDFSYSLENEEAWKVAKKFVSMLREYDPKVIIDIVVNIRYLT